MILGISIEKVDARRLSDKAQQVSVKNSIKVVDVDESEFPIGKDKIALKFHFVYAVSYEPKIGLIDIHGYVSYLADKDSAIVKDFQKTKKIKNSKISAQIVNTILTKCNIKSLTLAQDLNLPLPVQLPKVAMKPVTSAASYIG